MFRQLRHLDFISQFSTDIRHAGGIENIVADTLSHIGIYEISHPPFTSFKLLEVFQSQDEKLKHLLTSDTSLKPRKQYFPLEEAYLFCGTSQKHPRPFVSK